jgi:hypothetical protein
LKAYIIFDICGSVRQRTTGAAVKSSCHKRPIKCGPRDFEEVGHFLAALAVLDVSRPLPERVGAVRINFFRREAARRDEKITSVSPASFER